MKIKRTSWHYKLSHLGEYEKLNDSLCIYFWRLVLKLGLISFFIFVAVFIIYRYLTSPFIGAISVVLIFLTLSIVLPVFTIYKLRHKFGKSYKAPYENLIVEFIKAKKSKICPIIEYTE